MLRAALLASALLLAPASLASPVSRTPYQLKDRHHAPRHWKRVGRAPADHVIDVQIGLAQGNFAELERHLYQVSDPDHPRYGMHLGAEAVRELVRPTNETLDLVHAWLGDNGISPSAYSPAQDWITVTLSVAEVEQLLATEYHVYQHRDGTRVARALEWSLPAALHPHIDTIQPTNSFFRLSPDSYDHIADAGFAEPGYTPPANKNISAVCNIASVTPECFQTLYQTKGYKTKTCGVNKIGFTNYLGEHPIRSDAELFLAKYRPEAIKSATSFPQITIADGPGDYPLTADELEAGTSKEANLDVQAIAGISWKTSIVSYSTGGSPPFDPSTSTPENTNVWVNWLLAQSSFPQVITTSYGDDEQTVPESYAKRVCEQFAQVGVRGTTLLFSSGDAGVGPYGECVSNDGKNTTKFLPNFPASCPYITSVGATQNFEPEIVASRKAGLGPDGQQHGNYTSGGGFSNYFPTPEYQKDAVTSYVKNLGGRYDGLYNKAGRGYPDISAQGLYFAYFWNGTEGTISGTSASTPLLGGILSLVNDALISNGKPPMGFINPWLYAKGFGALTDITSGSAVGCGVEGFPATEGWDPVTGFGTPIFPKIINITGGKL
ncbi:tripeptidyl-peptidase 1 precursor [Xylariomycetidae sp. FL2044]|nr:tripeptidyl-peptidase 1 precursor [Xylariomycetidae sp. FL2044]